MAGFDCSTATLYVANRLLRATAVIAGKRPVIERRIALKLLIIAQRSISNLHSSTLINDEGATRRFQNSLEINQYKQSKESGQSKREKGSSQHSFNFCSLGILL
jgi:hypothetical protein